VAPCCTAGGQPQGFGGEDEVSGINKMIRFDCITDSVHYISDSV